MPSTVLIASPELLPVLQARPDLGDMVAFADADALKALDLIMSQRPKTVALERDFAATSRGTALINRIKADPSLTECEIRIIGSSDEPDIRAEPDEPIEIDEPPAIQIVVPIAAPLDQTGTRRAPRVPIVDSVEVQVDGKPATLVNLSIVGAQVVSHTILRPNQRVRFILSAKPKPVRISAVVAWAMFEIPKAGPRYRAGIEFFDPDEAAVQRVIDAHQKT